MFSGLIIVLISFFTLPLRFLRDTAALLQQIAAAGGVAAEGDERIPFLNWLLVAGKVVISTAAIVAIVIGVVSGLGLAASRDGGLGELLGPILGGALGAFVLIWVGAVVLESLALGVILVNNTRRMALHLGGGSVVQQPPGPRQEQDAPPVAAGPALCRNCGTPVGEGARFCTHCGTKV